MGSPNGGKIIHKQREVAQLFLLYMMVSDSKSVGERFDGEARSQSLAMVSSNPN